VAFDFRHVWGGLEIVPPLVEIARQAPNYPDFLRRMARTATDVELPLGFRKRLQIDDDGTIDVKKGAVVPICNLARFHALSRGITVSSTLGRLQAAEAEGALDVDTGDALRESFELVTRLRLEHQTALSTAGQPADNLVRVSDLPPLTRAQLTAAIKAIEAAQKQLSRFVPYGV